MLLRCCYKVVFVQNLNINNGTDGVEQILQDSTASKLPKYIYKEVHCFNCISSVGSTDLIALIFALVADSEPGGDLTFATCSLDFQPYVVPVLIGIMYLPYIVIVFCYWNIYRVVRNHNANISWQSVNVEHVKITKTLLATVVCFAILYVPSHGIFVAFLSGGDPPRQLKLMATFLVFTSCCVNPFIYGFMNRAFRHEFKKILTTKSNHAIASDSGSAQN